MQSQWEEEIDRKLGDEETLKVGLSGILGDFKGVFEGRMTRFGERFRSSSDIYRYIHTEYIEMQEYIKKKAKVRNVFG